MKAHTALAGLIRYSPSILFLSMSLSFLIMFAVEMFYYASLYGSRLPQPAFAYIIAFAIGVMIQSARLAFGVAGAYEFAAGRTGTGIIGMSFSLALAIFSAFEVAEISHRWAQDDPLLYNSSILILQAIVWLGFCLEIRLAITLSKQAIKKEEEEAREEPAGQLSAPSLPELKQMLQELLGQNHESGEKPEAFFDLTE